MRSSSVAETTQATKNTIWTKLKPLAGTVRQDPKVEPAHCLVGQTKKGAKKETVLPANFEKSCSSTDVPVAEMAARRSRVGKRCPNEHQKRKFRVDFGPKTRFWTQNEVKKCEN